MKRPHSDTNKTGGAPAQEASTEPGILTYLEFYAGVGGWGMALTEALKTVATDDDADDSSPSLVDVTLQCAAALDHSDLCIDVYKHNHQKHAAVSQVPPKQGKRANTALSTRSMRIEQISVEQLIACQAKVWMMSPPCQPHTRQHSNQGQDLQDPRSSSFLHLCHLLTELSAKQRPALILLENVVGFETSGSCRTWRQTLSTCDYIVSHFHLNPTQVGLPNDRPRYYSVAIHRSDLAVPSSLTTTSSTTTSLASSLRRYAQQEGDTEQDPVLYTSIPELKVSPIDAQNDTPLPPLSDFLDPVSSSAGVVNKSSLSIPDSIAKRNAAWCFDICTPASTHSACFTSSYGKYVRGTGSVLYTGSDPAALEQYQGRACLPQDREFDADWSVGLNMSDLRYFSGPEMARLFGFPETFQFPASCSLKQQWKLMGNSLNVRVAARVLELGLRLLRPASLVASKK